MLRVGSNLRHPLCHSVCVFVGAYWFVQEQWLSPTLLLFLSLLLASVGLAVSVSTWPAHQKPRPSLLAVVADNTKPCVLFITFLIAVSPILKTLTESISTDTIWAMTVSCSHYCIEYVVVYSIVCLLCVQVGMLLVHLLFFNYGSDGAM